MPSPHVSLALAFLIESGLTSCSTAHVCSSCRAWRLRCRPAYRSKAGPAAAREPAARMVKTEPVRQEALRRTVEIVGTLAAEDEVTISSQVDGIVRAVLADLGDPVKSGQTLVEIDREKLQYTLDEQKAAHARALTKYGASESGQLPPVEETAEVRKAAAELAQAKQSRDRAGELHKRTLIPQQALDDAETTLRLKAASYDAALQNARNLRTDVDASDAAMKLADRPLRDTLIRAPFDGYVQKRIVSVGRARQDPDAGDDGGARGSAETAGRDSRAHGAVDQGRPIARPAGGRVSRHHIRRDGVEDQPGRQHPDEDVRVRGAGAQSRRTAEARHVRARASRNRARRAGPDGALCGDAIPLRRLSGVHGRRRSAGRPRTENGRSASAIGWKFSAA